MENQDYQRTKSFEMPSDLSNSFLSTQPASPTYHPRALLDCNWNDGNDDLIMLELFRKYFGCQNLPESHVQNIPPAISQNENRCDVQQQPSTSRFQNNVIFESECHVPAAPLTGLSDLVTEHVPVPNAKHVAQILGKKGSKIRALRETTNTYIRSPLPREVIKRIV